MKTFSAAVLLALAAIIAAAQPSGVLGLWKTKSGSIIRIDRCSDKVCFTVVKMTPDVTATTDIHNPDPAQRSRPLCNLRIGNGFTLSDPNHAAGGTLYDPKTGKTYHGQMAIEGTKLHLRGYVGIPLFGASEIWTRPTEAVTPCNSAQQSH
jgi:uncharacterized protein (DUF2147 family)